MRIDRYRLAAGLGIALALCALFLFAYEAAHLPSLAVFEGSPIGGDFLQFWASARLVVMHIPEGAYWPDILTLVMATVNRELLPAAGTMTAYNNPLYYPPVYLLYLAPFGFLPFFPALLAFFTATAAIFFAGIWQVSGLRWLCLLMLGFAGVWLNLAVGQNGLLTAGLLALALAALMRGSPTLAGIFIGLLCYKPHLGLVIPLALLAGGHFRTFFFAAVTTIGAVFYALAVFGPETWLLSLNGNMFALNVLENQPVLWKRMPTLYAMLRLQGFAHSHALTAHLVLAALAVLAVLAVWWRTRNWALRGAALAAGMLLATPFVYDYDYAVLGMAFVLLVREAVHNGWRPADRILLPLMFIWPVMINKLVDFFFFNFGTYLQIGFLLPLGVLILVLRRARCNATVADDRARALQPVA